MEKYNKKPIVNRASIKIAAQKILSDSKINKEILLKNIDFLDPILSSYEKDDAYAIKALVNATVFVESFEKDNHYISERLRDGYIGKKVVDTTTGTHYLQEIRGKPFGTVVAISTKDNVVLGMSYIADDEKFAFPIVGLAIAIKRAMDGLAQGKISYEHRYALSKSRQQIIHFEKRALAYFHPDVYSYSRGEEGKKVDYDNYDEIHSNQMKILGKKSSKK